MPGDAKVLIYIGTRLVVPGGVKMKKCQAGMTIRLLNEGEKLAADPLADLRSTVRFVCIHSK